MKRNCFFGLLALMLLPSLALSQAYQKEDKIFSFGIGTGGDQPAQAPGYDATYDLRFRPVNFAFSFQYGLHEMVSIGGYYSPSISIARTGAKTNYFDNRDNLASGNANNDFVVEYNESTRTRYTTFYGIKAEFHLAEVIGLEDEFDPYIGASIGGTLRKERLRKGETTTEIEYYGVDNQFYDSDVIGPNDWESNADWDPGNDFGTISISLGTRYYMQDQLGIYGELGFLYLNSGSAGFLHFIQAGVSYKL